MILKEEIRVYRYVPIDSILIVQEVKLAVYQRCVRTALSQFIRSKIKSAKLLHFVRSVKIKVFGKLDEPLLEKFLNTSLVYLHYSKD